jgi:hypothetical protein
MGLSSGWKMPQKTQLTFDRRCCCFRTMLSTPVGLAISLHCCKHQVHVGERRGGGEPSRSNSKHKRRARTTRGKPTQGHRERGNPRTFGERTQEHLQAELLVEEADLIERSGAEFPLVDTEHAVAVLLGKVGTNHCGMHVRGVGGEEGRSRSSKRVRVSENVRVSERVRARECACQRTRRTATRVPWQMSLPLWKP